MFEKLDENVIFDPNTHIILNEARISDEAYNAYVKYWGKLNALSKGELDVLEVSDRLGRLRPLSSWPTKSTRIGTKRKWDEYNKKLQSRTDPEGLKNDENPCDDVDGFILQKLEDCLAANRYAGSDLAKSKCARQIGNLEQAIEDQCGEEAGDDADRMLDRIRKRLKDIGGQQSFEVDDDSALLGGGEEL